MQSTAPASTLPWVLASAVAFASACALAWRFVFQGDAFASASRRKLLAGYFALLAVSLLPRLLLSVAIEGVPTDIACFQGWANAAAENGLSRFYASSMFVDYPPGYIYVLDLVGRARLLLGVANGSPGFLLLVKLPAMLLDLAAAGFLLWFARARMSLPRACALSLLWAFNPASIHNSAVYGQVDVFLALPLVAALALVLRGRFVPAAAVYAVAVLIKPQALMLAPLAVLAVARTRSLRTIALSVLVAAATIVVLVLPFSSELRPLWLVELYGKTLGSYPYATLNAANLYALLGANWAPLDGRLLFFSYATFGHAALVAIVAATVWLYLGSRDPASVLVVALVVVAAVFFFATKMHERYLYPAVLVAAAAYAATSDPRLLLLFAGSSISVLVNEALLHDLVARTNSFFLPGGDPGLRLVSVLNAALLALAVKVALDVRAGRTRARAAATPSPPQAEPGVDAAPTAAPAWAPRAEPPRLSRVDLALMAALSAAYAAVAFWNLGAREAPQICWNPARAGQSAELDLGAPHEVDRVRYYMGLGEGSYTLAASPDGVTWATAGKLEQATPFEKFEWRELSALGQRARYLRVTATKPGAMLCELAAFEDGSRQALPMRAATPDAAPLADEPGTAVHAPSFFSGMYFDEIYHARTAYETLHRMEPSETTHPPLGKTFIAIGVAMFGMTPFGWRFVSTLFGVGMIPLMYLLAYRLFRRTDAALLASFLLAVDFLHFVQTRIATIDTYGVFFVMLMYLFMLRYLTRDFWRSRARDLLVPLSLSGAAFGLGVASKWNVLYGGAGLALLLLGSLLARWTEYRGAARRVAAGRGSRDDRRAAHLFPGRAAAVVAWCALAFVFVPAVLYVLAYVPFMLVPGPGHGLADVVSYQGHMYRYHAGLVATHPFSSAWWQWPIMQRPVWYYMGEGLPAGKISSIVALGNPAVWWPGIAAIAVGAYAAVRRRDAAIAFVLVGLAAQYVPWAVAPRKLVFLYHFFPAVPFLVLAVVWAALKLFRTPTAFRRAAVAYGAVALVLFAMYYPLLSGMPVSRHYVLHWLRWFDSWIFCV